MDRWHELDFERLQRMNVSKRRFVGWKNLKMFAISLRKRDTFYQDVENMCAESKSSCGLGILTPVESFSKTDKAQSGTSLECDLTQKIAEVEYHRMLHGAFLRSVRYGPDGRLFHPGVVSVCGGGGALSHVPLGSMKSRYASGMCQLSRNMVGDLVLVLVAIGRLTDIGRKAVEN